MKALWRLGAPACVGLIGFYLRGVVSPDTPGGEWNLDKVVALQPGLAVILLAACSVAVLWYTVSIERLDKREAARSEQQREELLQQLRDLYTVGRTLDASLPEVVYAMARAKGDKGSAGQRMDLVQAWDRGEAEWRSALHSLLEDRFGFGMAESVLAVSPPEVSGDDIFTKSAIRRAHIQRLERLSELIREREAR